VYDTATPEVSTVKNTTALLLGCMLTALAAGSASAEGFLDRCQKPLSYVDFVVDEAAKCAQGLAKGATTSSAAAPNEVTVDVAPGEVPPDLSDQIRAVATVNKLVDYFVYSAFVSGDEKKCVAAKMLVLPPRSAMTEDCVNEKRLLDLQKAWYGSATEFTSACQGLREPEVAMSRPCCEALERKREDPGLCSALPPQCFKSADVCHEMARMVSGTGQCRKEGPGLEGAQQQYERCLSERSYGAAAKAHDPKRCGGNARCRVLMGEGAQVVRDLSQELSKSEAGRWFVSGAWERGGRRKVHAPQNAPPAPPPKETLVTLPSVIPGFVCQAPLHREGNFKAFEEAYKFADACLNSLEALLKPTDAELYKAIDERREKLILTRMRLERVFQGPGATTRPAPKAGAAPQRAKAKGGGL